MTAGCAVPGTWSPNAARRVPPGLGGTRSPQNSRRLHNRRLSSPRKASLMRGVRGGSGAAGGAGCRAGEQGFRARARGVRGNFPEPLRSEERAKLRALPKKGPVRTGDGGGTAGSSDVSGGDRRRMPEPPWRRRDRRVAVLTGVLKGVAARWRLECDGTLRLRLQGCRRLASGPLERGGLLTKERRLPRPSPLPRSGSGPRLIRRRSEEEDAERVKGVLGGCAPQAYSQAKAGRGVPLSSPPSPPAICGRGRRGQRRPG